MTVKTPEITTQAQLEEMLSDPLKLADYIKGWAREAAQQEIAENREVRRVPLDPNATNPDSESVKGLWTGLDVGKAAGSIRRAAKGLDGQFEGFNDFLEKIHPNIRQLGVDSRLLSIGKALGEGQGDQGGFLVPDQYSNMLLSLALEQAIIRSRAFRMPMAGLTLRMPSIRDTSHSTTVHGGVRGYWTPESGAVVASEPTFGSVTLTAYKLTGYTTAANELLADSAIPLEALITRIFGDAIPYFEDDAFINGTGAGQPTGILNAAALISVVKETGQAATTIVKENLDKMFSRMLPSSVNRAVWLAHPDTIPHLFSLSQSVGTGGSAVMVANIANAPTYSIYGRPVLFTEKCQTVGTAGDIFFVDLGYYLVGDRQGLEMSASPHVRFTNDETVYKFVMRLDGKPWLDSALTPRNGTNTLSPFVALATRS